MMVGSVLAVTLGNREMARRTAVVGVKRYGWRPSSG